MPEPVIATDPPPAQTEPTSLAGAREAAVTRGKEVAQTQVDDANFQQQVDGAVDHILQSSDLAALEREVVGDQELVDKIHGWSNGISPDNKAKLDSYRAKHKGQQPLPTLEAAPTGGEQQPAVQQGAGAFGAPVQKAGVTSAAPADTSTVPAAATPVAPVAGAGVIAPAQGTIAAAAPRPVAAPTPATLAVADDKPKFNPMTGQPLTEGESVGFDPQTGLPLNQAPAVTGITEDQLSLRLETFKADILTQAKAESTAELNTLQGQLDDTNGQLTRSNAEVQSLISQRDKAKGQKQALQFEYVAKQLGVTEGMEKIAFDWARQNIVNNITHNPNLNHADENQRVMKLEEVIGKLKELQPGFFNAPRPQESNPEANDIGMISPGTGNSMGGNQQGVQLSQPSDNSEKPKTMADAKELLRKRGREKFGQAR